jgi:hypothetical protein
MLNRRKFIGTASVATAGILSEPSRIVQAIPKANTELGKVKIKDVKTAAIKIKNYHTHLYVDQILSGTGIRQC